MRAALALQNLWLYKPQREKEEMHIYWAPTTRQVLSIFEPNLHQELLVLSLKCQIRKPRFREGDYFPGTHSQQGVESELTSVSCCSSSLWARLPTLELLPLSVRVQLMPARGQGRGFELNYPFKHLLDFSQRLYVVSHPQRGRGWSYFLLCRFSSHGLGQVATIFVGKLGQISQRTDWNLCS